MIHQFNIFWIFWNIFWFLVFLSLLEMLGRGIFHKQLHISPDAIPEDGDGAMFVGHSTTLFRIAGTVVLTDPLLTSRYYGYNRRYVSVGVRLEDLARVDVVVISHTHPDHNHPASLRVLSRYNQHLTIVVPAGYAKSYRYAKRYKFAEVVEVPRFESVNVKNLTITNVPAQHAYSWGASGWVFQVAGGDTNPQTPARVVYFAGDTGYNQSMFQDIGSRFSIDLAILPMGCFRGTMFFGLWKPSWGRVHMGPRDFPNAIADLHARAAFPIHWGTIMIGCEPIKVPPTCFKKLRDAGVMPDSAHLLQHGTWHPMEELLSPDKPSEPEAAQA
jgi:L-ascorbate metabolism protein UlaG (beta-lactamase superfamily)